VHDEEVVGEILALAEELERRGHQLGEGNSRDVAVDWSVRRIALSLGSDNTISPIPARPP